MSTKFLKTILPSGAIRFAFPKEKQSRFATCVCGAADTQPFHRIDRLFRSGGWFRPSPKPFLTFFTAVSSADSEKCKLVKAA